MTKKEYARAQAAARTHIRAALWEDSHCYGKTAAEAALTDFSRTLEKCIRHSSDIEPRHYFQRPQQLLDLIAAGWIEPDIPEAELINYCVSACTLYSAIEAHTHHDLDIEIRPLSSSNIFNAYFSGGDITQEVHNE